MHPPDHVGTNDQARPNAHKEARRDNMIALTIGLFKQKRARYLANAEMRSLEITYRSVCDG